jgi:hypothetical protein
MSEYYYTLNGEQTGPISLEEIRALKLSKNTLVWTEGMETWKMALEVEEIKTSLRTPPPPLPKLENTTSVIQDSLSIKDPSTKYDENYERETETVVLGVAIIIFTVLVNYSGILNPDVIGLAEEDLNTILVLLVLVIRILAVIKVVNVSKRQNRNQFFWGAFSFLLPAFALIIIGNLRKFKGSEEVTLIKLAEQQFNEGKYPAVVETTNQILSLNSSNDYAFKIQAVAKLRIKEGR